MAQKKFTELFGGNGPTLTLEADLDPGTQQAKVGATLSGAHSFDALGSRFELGAECGIDLALHPGAIRLGIERDSIHPDAPRLEALGEFPPPANHRWATLAVRAGLDLAAAGAAARGAVAVSWQGRAGLRFDYREVLAAADADVAGAAGRLVKRARLPLAWDPKSFGPNEWHDLRLSASLGFDAELIAGKTLTLDAELAPLVPVGAPAKLGELKVLARAALGLELLDELRIGAGTLPAEHERWVRYRLERFRQGKVSFGASLALDLWFNKQVVERLLDHALGELGYGDVRERLLAIAGAIDLEDLTIERLEEKLSGELFEAAKRLLPLDDVAEGLADAASGLLDAVAKLQEGYAKLDAEFQGLVDSFLGTTGLDAGSGLRAALEELRELGTLSPAELFERVTGGALGDIAPLLDLLGTDGLANLLLDGQERLHREIGRLSSGAGSLLRHLEELEETDLASMVERLTGSQRVRRIVEFLNDAPATADEFRAKLLEAADTRLRGAIERLLGKALDGFAKKSDLEKRLKGLKAWAAKLQGHLQAAAAIDQRLRSELAKITDRVGVVVSFSVDRLTRRSALVDVELDPRDEACQRAFRALGDGDLVRFTELLPFEPDDRDEDESTEGGDVEPPAEDPKFRFHRFVLATARATTLTWIVAPSIGAGTKRTKKAFDESTLEIVQHGAKVHRTGIYGGGLVLATSAAKEGALRSWMGSVWIRSSAAASTPSLSAPYETCEHEIRLSTVRYDDELTAERIAGLDSLLDHLGCGPTEVSSRVPPDADAVRVAVEIAVRGEQVASLLGDLDRTQAALRHSATLDGEFLDAASRFLAEPLVSKRWGTVRASEWLPRVVTSPEYRDRWKSGNWAAPFEVPAGGKTERFRATPQGSGHLAPILQSIGLVRSWSNPALSRLGRAHAAASTSGSDHGALVELSRAFRRAARSVAPNLAFWPSPLFLHWLVFERLKSPGQPDPAVSCVASISWRVAGEWQPEHFAIH